ncbi:hypothetical protein HMPREF0731_1956 [Pseudoroseomonas cervicalis ATCC 49957]|uniref:Uncharacterized protein n=1 Tax=Pseudoroseomonas cervicalis ATCC 49957 TaxID=525371 RepID=D5RLJ5_9PROT|nr:hypothetical protein HMPREF0731_1956 [Pseudoroseomonas cervicalis ATCC 49957]
MALARLRLFFYEATQCHGRCRAEAPGNASAMNHLPESAA